MVGSGTPATGADPIWAADNLEVTPAGGISNAVGDTVVATPPLGARLVIRYLMYNPEQDNTVHWRLGLAGTPLLRNKLVAMSVISRGFDYPGTKLRGAIDESLYLVNANGTPVNYTACYTIEVE